MSKDNMEELQRYRPCDECLCLDLTDKDGIYVLHSDVAEREARLKARIEDLEVTVSGKTMFDGAEASEARWRERIERLVERLHDEPGSQGYWLSKQVRSLLDSGEERECPDCEGEDIRGCSRCDGSGRANPSPALEECTNCDGTGTRFSEVAWDDLTCGRCNGNKAVPAGSQEGKFGGPGGRRPSPSPALHREGRGGELHESESGFV